MESKVVSERAGHSASMSSCGIVLSLGALAFLVIAPVAWYLFSPLVVDRKAQDDPVGAEVTATGAVVARGSFGVVDAIHKGEGDAVLSRLPDGRYRLSFEEFRVTNGPDLYVYLSGHSAPRNATQLHEIGGLEVATLKGNVGEQSYDLPADLDPGRFASVVVYCKRFTTVFSTAELRPA